ncbi:MAG: DUF4158 domain-containing protein [Leptolyngbyaceae cyanobacterium RM2_2_4]|nr:DUF4158 domain-containing protein [Leptolyngbyaceae cyanobacterium RM2_2_4]
MTFGTKKRDSMKRDWTIPELQDYWTLQPGELNLLTSKNDENRLGFALLLRFSKLRVDFQTTKVKFPESAPHSLPSRLIFLSLHS